MQHYIDVIQDRSGNVIGGAIVVITDNSTGLPVTVYSDAGGSIVKPTVTTDTTGTFDFYVPGGRYNFLVTKNGTTLKTVTDVDIVDYINLSASTGSTLVGTIQSRTGSVTRTVASKSNDVVSVKDFGAVGNGVTDDYAAFLAAINSLSAEGGKIIVPDASYVLNSTLTWGTKSIYWDIGTGCIFSGTGVGVSKFPYMTTNPAQMAVGPYIKSSTSQLGGGLVNGGTAAFNVEAIQPPAIVQAQTVGIYFGASGSSPNTTANVWGANGLISVASGAKGTYQCVELDVNNYSSVAGPVKGISCSGIGTSNATVAFEALRADTTRWTYGIHILHSVTGLKIENDSAGFTNGIVVGNPVGAITPAFSAIQAANSTDLIYGQRFTDASQAGNFIRFTNNANTLTLFSVGINGDVFSNGILQAGAKVTTPYALLTGGATAGAAGQISLGNSTTNVATAGTITAPAQVAGYWAILIGSTAYKIPYYNN